MKKIRDVKLTNTLTGKKEILQPISPGKLRFYSCGPTVYGLIHIGNLRTALTSDLFFRYFKKIGYDVNFVRNYTDVDDKIIKRAAEEGMSTSALAQKYISEVEVDFNRAGMAEPTHKATVTGHMADIIHVIEKIVAAGHAYVMGGDVFYSIESFPSYGKLSHKNIDELLAGARVDVNEKKKNPLDFALWKAAKEGEPFWVSPWGKGRPGWHIECSAMASALLGDQIDIHHGGEDLIFPHHENEIAQSEGAACKEPFVRVWLHSAFLNLSKEKMSKSLGNVILARDFLQKFGTEVSRYLLLSVHYRSPLDFNEESLEHVLTALHRLYEAKLHAQKLSQTKGTASNPRGESLWVSFVAECERIRGVIDGHFANDFNAPGVLAALFSLIRDFNRIAAEGDAAVTGAAARGAAELIRVMEEEIAPVLGIGGGDPARVLKEIERIRSSKKPEGGVSRPSTSEIEEAIQLRSEARKAKNFTEADRIRNDLESRGVLLKDSPQGTTWTYV